MRAARQFRSGNRLAATDDGQAELFDGTARGAGGSMRALREHLAHVEAELRETRSRILALEEVVISTPSRPLQRLLNPSNWLQSNGSGAAVVRVQSRAGGLAGRGVSVGQSRVGQALDFLRGLPWPQIFALLALLGVLLVLGVVLKRVMG